jgi:UDP-glucose 4-epimerase
MPKSTTIVTGGAGFIGSHLVDALLAKGHAVVVLDDLSTGKREQVPTGARLIEIDLADAETPKIVSELSAGLVFHLAAQKSVRTSVDNPALDARINIQGLLNLMEGLRASANKPQVVFTSTGGAIYGDGVAIPTPEDALAKPISPYGVAKLSSEHYLDYYQQIHGIQYAAMRLANVYGPRQDPKGEAGVVAIFSNRALDNKALTINGAGTQTRDYVFVGDVVDALVRAAEKKAQGAFNVGTSIETDVNTLAATVVAIAKSSSQLEHIAAKPGEQQRSALDISKAKKVLGFSPSTDLAAGVRQTVEWFRESLSTVSR